MMMTTYLRQRVATWMGLSTLFIILLSGCGGGGHSNTLAAFTSPPAPALGKTPADLFYYNSPNYFYLYTKDTAPFDPGSQFTDHNYPVPLYYQTVVSPPDGFVLKDQSEFAIQLWAQADPRVTVISGVGASDSRVKVFLVNSINYNNMNDIIGLTKLVGSSSDPHFEVYVAILDPVSQSAMSNLELLKTLTHELGHAFGLGHSPDQHDLMYFQANGQQGPSPQSFLTHGDAMAIWSTLNNRHINWITTRPVITPFTAAPQADTAAPRAIARVTDEGGTVVCVYTRH